jgi:hypothetical protein
MEKTGLEIAFLNCSMLESAPLRLEWGVIAKEEVLVDDAALNKESGDDEP